MKRFKFKKIDAFSSGTSAGNPAAAVYVDSPEQISPDEMQRIARELKGFVSEVVYVFTGPGEVSLRYFSSECEVDFCGHGTVAVMHDLIRTRPEFRSRAVVDVMVRNERLPVYNTIQEKGAVFISAPAPSFHPLPSDLDCFFSLLGHSVIRDHPRYSSAHVNAGLNTLIIPMADLNAVLSASPHEPALKEWCLASGVDIVLIFTDDVHDSMNTYRTRVFAPKFGYLEDPATGSGNSAFGYYLLKQGLWDGSFLTIEQNNSRSTPNIILLDTVEDGGVKRVIFGGPATVRIEGDYIIE